MVVSKQKRVRFSYIQLSTVCTSTVIGCQAFVVPNVMITEGTNPIARIPFNGWKIRYMEAYLPC